MSRGGKSMKQKVKIKSQNEKIETEIHDTKHIKKPHL